MAKRRVTPNIVFSRLLRSAREAATFRGHTLGRFADRTTTRDGARIRSTARCRHCDATVSVDTYPEPNGIDIGGSAVAIGCRPACPTCHSTEGQYVPPGSGDAHCLHCDAEWPAE